jgi:hypothetical protein
MAELKFLSALRTTADDIQQDVRTFISRAYKRANTVFTDASPYAQIIRVMSEIGELLMFYIEDSTVEQNIYTAQQAESIYGLSRLTGHDATRGHAAFGELKLRWKPGVDFSKIAGPNLTIDGRAEFTIKTNGLTYTLLTNKDAFRLDKSNYNTLTIPFVQGKFETQTLTSTGEGLQSFNIKPGQDMTDHDRVVVYVNGEAWTKHVSLYDMHANEKAYMVKTAISGGLDVYFGNGNFGMIPAKGAQIKIEYVRHAGSSGNLVDASGIEIDWVTEGSDSVGNSIKLGEFFDVTVSSAPKMGADRESTRFTKILTPMASKSFVLATPDNYEYFLSRYGMFSYIDAYNSTEDAYLDDDNVIYIFATPDVKRKVSSGQDYFSIPQQEMFFTQSEYDGMLKVLQDSGQMMVTTEVKFVKPQVRYYSMDVQIRYFEGFSKSAIMNEIRQKISEYLLNVTRRDKLPKSDIVYILEAIEGIDSVNIRFISETEETARRLGYYESVTYTVQPQEPVTLEDIGNGKQKYVFFKKIETVKRIPVTESTEIPNDIKGLDNWGDIIMDKDEVAVFRGGWQDREGDVIVDDVLMNAEAALSINFDSMPVPRTVYTRVQAGTRNALK